MADLLDRAGALKVAREIEWNCDSIANALLDVQERGRRIGVECSLHAMLKFVPESARREKEGK